MRAPAGVLCALLAAACGSEPARAPATIAPVLPYPVLAADPAVMSSLATLQPAWTLRSSDDFPIGLGLAVTTSGELSVVHDGSRGHVLDRAGHELGRWPRDRARGVVEPFVVADGSRLVTAGYRALLAVELPQGAVRWEVSPCGHDRTTDAESVVLVGDRVFAWFHDHFVAVAWDDGRCLHDVPVPAAPFGEHRVAVASGHVALRTDHEIIGFDADLAEQWRMPLPASFGLAATGEGFVIAVLGEGLRILDPASGREVRRLPDRALGGAPDPFTSRLGELYRDGDVVFAESLSELRAWPLTAPSPIWRAPIGGGGAMDAEAFYACDGSGRVVAIDRASGRPGWSWSVDHCRILGVAGDTVLVHAGGAADLLIAFRRGPAPVPLEHAVVTGIVHIDGVPAPGQTVLLGRSWLEGPGGIRTGWNGGPMTAAAEPVRATTDARGRYTATLDDRGIVPIIVDAERARASIGRPRVTGIRTHLELDGSRRYTVDFDVRGAELEL